MSITQTRPRQNHTASLDASDAPSTESAASAASAAARRAMIDSQLRTSGVNEEFVLERMMLVPRENHVPARAHGTAYIDRAITLENGRQIAAPLFYGMVLEEAQPQADDTVLVIDAGSGYLPALVRPLVSATDVLSPEEAASARHGPGTYSLVLIDGAVTHIPNAVAKSVAAGGRIVTGMSNKSVTCLATGRQSDTGITLLPLAEIGIPRLTEFDIEKGWSF